MSLIKLSGNPSGTGAFTIAAPNSNTDRTLTLPDNTGTVLTDQSTVSSTQIASALNASGSAPIYACRAWVSFSAQSGVITVRGSGNVSSVVRVSMGIYTVSFATAMQDGNYCALVTRQSITSNADASGGEDIGGRTTGSMRLYNIENNAASDTNNMSAAVFR